MKIFLPLNCIVDNLWNIFCRVFIAVIIKYNLTISPRYLVDLNQDIGEVSCTRRSIKNTLKQSNQDPITKLDL